MIQLWNMGVCMCNESMIAREDLEELTEEFEEATSQRDEENARQVDRFRLNLHQNSVSIHIRVHMHACMRDVTYVWSLYLIMIRFHGTRHHFPVLGQPHGRA